MKMRHKRFVADARRHALAWQCSTQQRWRLLFKRTADQGLTFTGRLLDQLAQARNARVRFPGKVADILGDEMLRIDPAPRNPGEWKLTPGETRTWAGGTLNNMSNWPTPRKD